LSNLDAALRVHMRMELAKLHADLGATMAYVTHDQVEAMTLADRIVVLNGGEMRQVGSPLELYHTPADMFVAGFIGSPKMNFIEGRVVAAEDHAVTVETEDFGTLAVPVIPARGTRPGEAVTLGVRPEHVLHEPEGRGTACRIEIAEHIGDHAILKLHAPSGRSLIASASGKVYWQPGHVCTTSFDAEHMHLFDAEGRALKHRETPKILRTAAA
jgi:multiple sugar transport system ATP-binding protein